MTFDLLLTFDLLATFDPLQDQRPVQVKLADVKDRRCFRDRIQKNDWIYRRTVSEIADKTELADKKK